MKTVEIKQEALKHPTKTNHHSYFCIQTNEEMNKINYSDLKKTLLLLHERCKTEDVQKYHSNKLKNMTDFL